MTDTSQYPYNIGSVSTLDLVREYAAPLYVYDAKVIEQQYQRLDIAFSAIQNRRINYAMKALNNINILKLMRGLGSGIDAVSVNEVLLALKAGFDPQDIVFTPSGVSIDELDRAVELGVCINIDSLEILEAFADKYPQVSVGIRINPHILAGGHAKISVGDIDSKFGISVSMIDRLVDIVKTRQINIDGVHMHTGSDICDIDVFLQGADILFEVAKRLPSVRYIDFGSGFKVPYKSTDKSTDIELLGAKLSQKFNDFTKAQGRDMRFMIEPGKFLVSRAGTLLVDVNWVKQGPTLTFAQVNSGLNHLLRPMMYDAYHHIINISNPQGQLGKYNVTGYVCETDTFAKDVELNEVRQGDVLAILNAGAYGFTMSSNYNSRLRPAEVLVIGKNDYLISKRETFEDLIKNQIEVDL